MKFNSVFIYFSVFLFVLVNPAFSQKVDSNLNEKMVRSNPIKGTVLNQNNEPMIQAAVVVLSKSTGTLTNIEGQFILYVPNLPVTLRVTSPGCISLDTTISINNSKLSLKLNCDDAFSKSEHEEVNKKFLKGRFELPVLGRFIDFDSLPPKAKYD